MELTMVSAPAQLALDTILQKPTAGIPSWALFPIEHAHIERLAGFPPGSYRREPEKVYVAMQRAIGTCMLDQYIPENPLTMGNAGYEDGRHGATTGAHSIVLNGMEILSPEDVAAHLERFEFPRLRKEIAEFDEDRRVKQVLDHEQAVGRMLGPDILKCAYGVIAFPALAYGTYGYANYFAAYALYPDVIEEHFSLQADAALLNNRAVARAYVEGRLPPFGRLDHDMADSRGTLVNVRSLDCIWFPHFTRCLESLLKAGIRLIWHCDGNLMQMVPRLLEAGVRGFQGFQYEDGMDYERICRMKTRDGEDLIILAGVSVTHVLPGGKADDVRRELSWLVEHGPRTGLFLGGSSSIVPGTPWENVLALVDGLKYYRTYPQR
jgi:hypothetical protein